MDRLNAVSIGYATLPLLVADSNLEVHSIFNRVINLMTGEGRIVSISTLNVPNFPSNIVTAGADKGRSFKSFGLEQGIRARYSEKCITLGPLQLDLCQAKVYTPSIWGALPTADKTRVSQLLVRVSTIAAENSDGRGLAPLLPYISPMPGSTTIGSTDPFCRVAWEATPLLLECRRNLLEFPTLAAPLVGLGPGLTPSGDDLIAGMMMAYLFACKSLGENINELSSIFLNLLPYAQGTTILSREMLIFAAQGQLTEAAERVAQAVLGVQGLDLEATVSELLEYGASSGVDQLVGIIVGFRAALGL